MNTSITQFAQQPAVSAGVQNPPAIRPQAAAVPALDSAGQDSLTLAAQPASSSASADVQFGGLGKSIKRLLRSSKQVGEVKVDAATIKVDHYKEIQKRKQLPERLEKKLGELIQKYEEVEQHRKTAAGVKRTHAVLADEALKAVEKKEAEIEALEIQAVENPDLEDAILELIWSKREALEELEEKYTWAAEDAKIFQDVYDDMHAETIAANDLVKDARRQVKRAERALARAESLNKAKEMRDEVGINEDGRMGELYKMLLQAEAIEAEAEDALRGASKKSYSEQVEERKKTQALEDTIEKKEFKSAWNERKAEIKKQLANNPETEEIAGEKTNSTSA